ncbi:MAG TPA: iron ABC transporter permease, partial [Candidatus Binatia bacterium]|nr:iron ABC transporter permease [Candidatus Binatia bacterium]
MPLLRRRFDARFFLLVGVAVVVVYLTLVPILMVIYGSFRDGPPGASAAFTLRNYIQAFSNPQLYRAFSNSLVFAFGGGSLAFAIGGFLAWL